MAYRRDRNMRDVYDERFLPDRPAPYPRSAGAGPVERRPAGFGRPDEEYNRGFEYDGPRFYPNGGPRGYHGEDQRGYHGDSLHFPNERRGIPPSRRPEEPYPYPSRPPPREDPHTTRQMEFRSSGRAAPPPPSVRAQGMYPAPRSLSAVVPEGGDDTLMQAILNLDRGRKGPLPPLRADVPPSPHSRSGSTVSSKSYSPDRAKGLPHPAQQKNKDRPPGHSQDGSPQSIASTKEEAHVLEWDREEGLPPIDETPKTQDDFQERRAQAIGAKAREIEQVYRQDCETFGMVVKMLVAKDANLEKQLQTPLRENLGEIRERCLDDLKHFITDLDQVIEVVRQPEPST
ncbi:periphilin-1 isoform X1 [Oncorhynchus tshawytscha]|uniref:Periphilin-1 C-terminal domain-containing protein n=2 Tax=Oncorhynchus TaxID=8016 RepID=A0AAZ3SV02_ONCTS|nr:periphilin-1 isoform X3 [Oncorhynchus mykiss]XP_036812799.1 periphilin-1 isoform X1 [Oncorhynchus mykiss]XP_036812800.1 periphilin-1 isoform X1 [Oncorhynchus mykiss]XP_036812801.1 periphilin-1 isoform X1 [Oncorhynchus mykiss]XP_036812802.1 periphilin-1 isoform X1 [Oncorhynchus mykiss]XP_036812803.1 periphilin-1 isoform X1 [Oncorhynchus mykiss]XP_036812804.1 periphilin-1 isoform X1 [Oncorhynchus mykiss]XP_036812805.1 periphilin-1 isoform X1 [Oncorhynchus mykiss]XP_036812806.1 periphilin-1